MPPESLNDCISQLERCRESMRDVLRQALEILDNGALSDEQARQRARMFINDVFDSLP